MSQLLNEGALTACFMIGCFLSSKKTDKQMKLQSKNKTKRNKQNKKEQKTKQKTKTNTKQRNTKTVECSTTEESLC